MGATESLIVQRKNVKISKLGIPTPMDLHTGKTYGLSNPDIQVQAWIDDQRIKPGAGGRQGRFDWRCVVTVPSGGLQARAGGEFDFEAPADGYQPSDQIAESGTAPAWKGHVSREYFVKLSGSEYARISLTLHAGGDHFFSITSYLNPIPEHRNLEYNPRQQISAP